jgi:hypothetical protein
MTSCTRDNTSITPKTINTIVFFSFDGTEVWNQGSTTWPTLPAHTMLLISFISTHPVSKFPLMSQNVFQSLCLNQDPFYIQTLHVFSMCLKIDFILSYTFDFHSIWLLKEVAYLCYKISSLLGWSDDSFLVTLNMMFWSLTLLVIRQLDLGQGFSTLHCWYFGPVDNCWM